MKYMVMECNLSYAVVLDEEGHFLKVANRHYEVGQTVTEVIEMRTPEDLSKQKKPGRWVYPLAAMAACMALAAASVLQIGQMTYASVYMTINPEVRIDVNRRDVVVDLDGVNADGDELIAGYDHRKKDLDLVMDELVDRAIDMGYLHEGGRISLVLDADNDEWIMAHSDTLSSHLNEHLEEKLTVTIDVAEKKASGPQITIPVDPGESDYGGSDYNETNYSESDYESSDYGQTDAPALPGVDGEGSDHGDSLYTEGQTDYDSRYETGESDYGADSPYSDYGEAPGPVEGESDLDAGNDGDSGVSDYGDDLSGTSDYDGEDDPAEYPDADSGYDDDHSGVSLSDYGDDLSDTSDYDTDDDVYSVSEYDEASDYETQEDGSDYGTEENDSDYGEEDDD